MYIAASLCSGWWTQKVLYFQSWIFSLLVVRDLESDQVKITIITYDSGS